MALKFTPLRLSLLVIAGGFAGIVTLSSNSKGIQNQSVKGCVCHGSTTMADTATHVTLSGLPAGGYMPGRSYVIAVTVNHATQPMAGFNMSVTAGTLSNASPGMAINGNQAYHTSPAAIVPGLGAVWTCTWTAPAASTGPVTCYIAGNAVIKNGNVGDDVWNNVALTYNETAGSNAIATMQSAGFRLYPNPAGDYLILEGPQDAAISVIYIRDVTGRLITAESPAGRKALRVSTKTLPAGAYLLTIVGGDGRVLSAPFNRQ